MLENCIHSSLPTTFLKGFKNLGVLFDGKERLGINFVVENHKGAGGQLGYTTLSQAEPDGYTIGTITTMSIVTHELTREDIPYTLRDSFAPIARIVLAPSGFYVPADSPFETLEDLVEYAKGNPGKLSLASDILWGTHHVQLKLLEKAAGITDHECSLRWKR